MTVLLPPDPGEMEFRLTFGVTASRICRHTNNNLLDVQLFWENSDGNVAFQFRTLVFVTPVISDAGVYKCVARSRATGEELRSSIVVIVECK